MRQMRNKILPCSTATASEYQAYNLLADAKA